MTYWDTNTVTVWEISKNEWGEPSYGDPYTVAATWSDTGSTQTDADGNQFVPESTYYMLTELQRGWYISKGDKTSFVDPLAAGAQKIKKVTQYDISQFNSPPEYEVMT